MAKTIIVSLDGTLDYPTESGKAVTHIQNIHSLPPKDNDMKVISNLDNAEEGWSVVEYGRQKNVELVKYYDAGLGAPTTNWWGSVNDCTNPLIYSNALRSKFKQIKQAAFGIGITHNVAQAYHFLAINYEASSNEPEFNDKVFCYGFSRGAYTLLLLVAMIRQIGLINIHSEAFKKKYKYKGELQQAILDGFKCFDSNKHPDINIDAQKFKNTYCHDGKHLIHFLGLFEPVKGIVIETLHAHNHISNVPKIVRIAYAINEKRKLFKPEIYIPSEESHAMSVWMPGSHSDIGGSRNNGLANISLHWMMQESERYGLEHIDMASLSKNHRIDACGPQHNSMSDKVPFTELHWRDISQKEIRKIPVATHHDHTIHPTTYERYGNEVEGQKNTGELKKFTYNPGNVEDAVIKLNNPSTDKDHQAILWYNYRHGYPVPQTLGKDNKLKIK